MTQKAPWILALAVSAGACGSREVAVFEIGESAGKAGSPMAGGGSSGLGGSGGAGGTPVGGGGGTRPAETPDITPNAGDSNGVSGSPAGGFGGDTTYRACSGDECMPGWVCDRPRCDDLTGVCSPRPALCPADAKPVCGCDGVTYWNDCIRLQAGVSLGTDGQCRVAARSCDVGSDCGVPDASCSHLVSPSEMCQRGAGDCWVLPPVCVPEPDSRMWRQCRSPNGSGPGPCVDTCTAIASGRTHTGLRRGETCK